jgi:hypothetical protein
VDKKIDIKKFLFIVASSILIILNVTDNRSKFFSQISYQWINLSNLNILDGLKKDNSLVIQSQKPQVVQADNTKCIKNGDSVATRLVLYKEAVRIFLMSPITGVGPGGYGKLYCGDYDEFASPHSLFLQLLAEFGLVGFILLIINFLIVPISYISKSQSKVNFLKSLNIRLMISLWLFFMIYEMLSGNIYYAYHFFLISGILISLICNSRECINEKPKK